MTPPTACAHCGLPAPATLAGQPAFCCRGCETVYEVLTESGLAGYYAIRARVDPVAPGRARPSVEPDREASRWAHLDNADTTDANDRGRCDLRVTGLHCAACAWVLERLPAVLDGVEEVRVDLAAERLHLRWDPTCTRLSTIAGFTAGLGYGLHSVDRDADDSERRLRRRDLVRLGVSGAAAGNVMLYSLALYFGAFSGMDSVWVRYFTVAAAVVSSVSVAYGAAPFYRGAVAGLRVGRLHMDLPIAVGVLGGYVASLISTVSGSGEVYFDSVTTLVFLLLVGRHVQRRGQRWALSHTHLLSLLVPPRATRIVGDGFETVPSAELRPGDRVFVGTDEPFPADGRVLSGRSSVDTSSVTGESLPRPVEAGCEVLAGTKNVGQGLEVEALATGVQTRIGGLAQRIMEADAQRTSVQHSVERVTGWFVATVLSLALVGAGVWAVLEPGRVFAVVVSLLVVSCPCALGLATPMALSVARARAAERGILLWSTRAIESLARVEAVVFDKTGTLTTGILTVCAVDWAGGTDDDTRARVAALVGVLEADSGHPVGRAMRRWAGAQATEHPLDRSVRAELARTSFEICDHGIHGVTRDKAIKLGSPAFVEDTQAVVADGCTPVSLSLAGEVVARFALADQVRADSKSVVEDLHRLGLKLSIYSGDHPQTVRSIAQALDIERAQGGMTPETKADAVAEDTRSHPLLMVGDGINDAAAFRAATVGMATQGGAEVSTHVADVHLRHPGLRGVVEAITGSRRALVIVRRNLAFSLAYNAIFAGLALAGWVSPLAAAVLMPASSLTVIASSVLWRFDASAPSHAPVWQRQTLPAPPPWTVHVGE